MDSIVRMFTRSPRRRNTPFCEFVQWRGARGFGCANIESLCEAMERDGLAGR